jgi:aromatic ring-opening dioxygenase LigB subunit
MIKFACICPHPPIIIPSIGKSQTSKAQATVEAMRKLRISLNRIRKTDKIFLISPHLPSTWDAFTLFYKDPYDKTLKGNFADFGDSETTFEFLDDKKTVERLKVLSGPTFPLMGITIRRLDHGTLVPLYYLWDKGKHKTPLLPMSFCSLSLKEHYKFGQFLGKFLEEDKNTWTVIASGDLSHRLASFAPAGFSPKAQKFDKLIVQFLKQKKIKKILNIDPELVREAGECGLRSIVLLLGIISSFNWKPKILSYEAPFGVGYLVAEIKLNK